MLDIGTEQFLLKKLFEDVPMTEQRLSTSVEAAGISIDRPANYIAEWCQSAAERGLIEPITNRWSITDAGRKRIGNDPGR